MVCVPRMYRSCERARAALCVAESARQTQFQQWWQRDRGWSRWPAVDGVRFDYHGSVAATVRSIPNEGTW